MDKTEISPLFVKLTDVYEGRPIYIYAPHFEAATYAPTAQVATAEFYKTYVYTTRHTYTVAETPEEVIEKMSAVMTLPSFVGCI